MSPASRRLGSDGVRRAEPRDLGRLVALWTDLARHHTPIDSVFELRPDADSAIEGLLREQLRDADAAVFVAEEGGVMLGFCCVRIDGAPPIFAERERAEITDLAVGPAWRRRGAGRALAGAALDWLAERGVRRVEVRVAARYAAGQAIWRAQGFGDLMDVLQRRL